MTNPLLIRLAAETGADLEDIVPLMDALEKVSPELPPSHPLEREIAAGPDALPELVRRLHDGPDLELVIDAIAQIVAEHGTDEATSAALLEVVSRAPQSEAAARAIEALASAGEPDLLAYQHRMLSSADRGEVASAVRLLGLGRHRPAVGDLIRLLHPIRASLAADVIWALGEIGDPAALPAIHAFLEAGVLAMEAAEAAGKLGDARTIRLLLLILEYSGPKERSEAARALGSIGARDALTPSDRAVLVTSLSLAVDRDEDLTVRFCAITALARIGEPLDRRRVERALGVRMRQRDMDTMAAFFARK